MKLFKSFAIVATLCFLGACSQSGSGGSSATAASALSLSPITVTEGGTAYLYPTGGSSPYTFSVMSSGGTLSSTVGVYTVYTAPSTAGTYYVLVTDAAGNSGYMTISVSSGTVSTGTSITTTTTTSSNVCEGTFTANIAGTAGTMTLVQDSSGYVGGYLYLSGYYYPISGSCSGSSISLTNWDFGTTYTGTVSSGAISGTMTVSDGTTYSWSAALSSYLTGYTITQSCEGTYTATINGRSGTLYLFGDSYGNVAGDLYLAGYNYVVVGTCVVNGSTSGLISLTNMTTNSTYTGSVTVSTSISLSGTFSLYGGSSYSWSAVSE
jgi:hypothetical protein